MGLQNLYSNLSTSGYPNHEDTSLKYGAGSPIFDGVFESNTLDFGKGTAFDRPNMSFSNQPFLNKKLFMAEPEVVTDGLVRGGIVTATQRSLQDVERISKFLLTPQGVGFLTKQTGLQRSNPVIRTKIKAEAEEGDNIFDKIGDFVEDLEGSFSNQRFYNLGVNTLASIAGAAAGIHVKREGSTPISDPNEFEGYTNDIKTISDNTSANRLIKLHKTHITNENDGPFILKPIDSYSGGPDSVYGIGQTTINQYVSTTFDSQLFGIFDDTITQETVELADPEAVVETNIDDTQAVSTFSFDDYQILKPPKDIGGYPGGTVRKKAYEARQGKISPYHVSYNGGPDAINGQGLKLSTKQGAYPSTGIKDFIPFRFEAVYTEHPNLSDFIVFRAFLDSFNDNFNAEHNSFNYNGRGETFYTYNGFTRNIDFSFKIAAQHRDEMKPLYQKLNNLISNTAPDYSEIGRMRTPFMKITVGDWCSRLPGILNSISLSWQKDYPWDLGGDPKTDPKTSGLILPHVLDVQVQFTPVHQFMPEKSSRLSDDPFKFKNTPFINITP